MELLITISISMLSAKTILDIPSLSSLLEGNISLIKT
jgi:hypothetical protein